eukprot:TRINITY_DN1255_c0_g1_i1.p1 TRINITY_DN1255_c0_g1~~TRINITY_DN1255_c0_g1_i1.p1  ORF type:complete len:135 (+),score=34.45 TRINITY_DN1255_c0_g1_i1:220-624(+)
MLNCLSTRELETWRSIWCVPSPWNDAQVSGPCLQDECSPQSPKGSLSRQKLLGILATAADTAMAQEIVGALSPGHEDVIKADFIAWALKFYKDDPGKLAEMDQALDAWSTWLKLDTIDFRIRNPKKESPGPAEQ